MHAPQNKTDEQKALKPSIPQRSQRRARKFQAMLNDEMFEDFLRPVTLEQVDQAIEFLDQNFGRWERDKLTAAADYVLPAIHRLFPEQKRFGFTAPFGPVQAPGESWLRWFHHWVFGNENVVAPARRESRYAR